LVGQKWARTNGEMRVGGTVGRTCVQAGREGCGALRSAAVTVTVASWEPVSAPDGPHSGTLHDAPPPTPAPGARNASRTAATLSRAARIWRRREALRILE
jgi:hypothetical protein